MADITQKITPMLWFDDQAEQAAEFYISIFRDSRIGRVARYGEAGPGPAGSAMTVEFVLEGQTFTALNGGPIYTFTEAISFVVACKDQAEVDHYWDHLIEGGPADAQQCGWLKDKFGVSWQIVPDAMGRLMSDPDPVKAQRTVAAMLQMKKLDVAALQAAHDGVDVT
jgi:predicted 3-demethylubiquinone-9 3-methyltransferase (glyoxalase superfamily)